MIKPEADAIFFSKYPEQRRLAAALGECFNATHGDRMNQFYFWLLEPHDNIRERFGLQQELLAIYSEFPRTDDRVSMAVAQIKSSPKFRYRLDRMLVLLIHRGEREGIEALAQRQRDYVMLPLHIDELLNPSRGDLFIRSKIAQAIGSIDLFGMSSPLTSDKYFFGRHELVQSLIARSTHASESSGLFGLRKTGKTSVLYAVQRRLADSPTIVEYLDCQSPGTHNLRWWELLDRVAVRCREAVKRERLRDVRTGGLHSL